MNKALTFEKMQATGNDFLIYDEINPSCKNIISSDISSEWISKICHRKFGIGADGLFILKKADNEKYNFSWDFFNSDGSSAEMCGNAARCAALYAVSKAYVPKQHTFKTLSGLVNAFVENENSISVSMNILTDNITKIEFAPSSASNETIKNKVIGHFLNTGVPHFVIPDNNWTQNSNYKSLSRWIQKQTCFPDSTNVTYYEELSKNHLRCASYERGVFDFTLACGTGAVAAALTYINLNENSPKERVKLDLPGGTLFVETDSDKTQLIGSAKFVASLIYKG